MCNGAKLPNDSKPTRPYRVATAAALTPLPLESDLVQTPAWYRWRRLVAGFESSAAVGKTSFLSAGGRTQS